MNKFFLLVLLLFAFANIVSAQAPVDASLNKAVLYSSIAHKERISNNCFSFEKGDADLCRNSKWDLIYGGMRVGDQWDWFHVSLANGVRSKIVGLGKHDWTDSIKVPYIEPFPKLKEGETRHITVDVSGTDGKPGEPGKKGEDGLPGMNGDGTFPSTPPPVLNSDSPENPGQTANNSQPVKQWKIDPVFIKADVGNMYALRVVDEDSDFYVLFRVESIEKGDKCAITWKIVPSPEK